MDILFKKLEEQNMIKREELISKIKDVFGEVEDGKDIELYEWIDDNWDESDWETKYKELDNAWRKRYRDRFFRKVEEDDYEEVKDRDEEEEETEEKTKYEELFEVKR